MFCSVDDSNAEFFRNVDKDPRPTVLELKRFRMRSKRDFARLFSLRDKTKAAAAIADPDLAGVLVITHVVCVVTELKSALKAQILPPINPESPIPCACYIQATCRVVVVQALWLLEPSYFCCAVPLG